jgi:hypothetical protein
LRDLFLQVKMARFEISMRRRDCPMRGLLAFDNCHRVQPLLKTEIEAILDIVEKVQARLEELRATVLQQQAMINAALLCLRDRTQSDPKELEKLFQYYQQVVHQQLLRINKETTDAMELEKSLL